MVCLTGYFLINLEYIIYSTFEWFTQSLSWLQSAAVYVVEWPVAVLQRIMEMMESKPLK